MVSNQASMARRQRERERKAKQQEKAVQRAERREQKGKVTAPKSEDPMNDPTIDWGDAVREVKLLDVEVPDEGATETEP